MGRIVVTAKAEKVGVGYELDGVNRVLPRNRPDCVTELAALTAIDIPVGVPVSV
jgi:hypothetical protein